MRDLISPPPQVLSKTLTFFAIAAPPLQRFETISTFAAEGYEGGQRPLHCKHIEVTIMDAVHVALAQEEDRETIETTLASLQKYFQADFVDDDGERYLQSDERMVRFVPAILAVTVKLAEKNADQARAFTSEEVKRIMARKAAELYAMIPGHLLYEDVVYEHCETRRILGEAMLDGILSCGMHGEFFDHAVASALLFSVKLSTRESETLLNVMHERFAHSSMAGIASRFLLSIASDSKALNPELTEAILKACIEYAQPDDRLELIEALKKAPVTRGR